MNNNIPNKLQITINTDIPGFQNIKYKPYMSFPNDKTDDSVQFNPLVKLKPSIIQSLPKDIQIKEFVNKGLFQSLINSHGLVEKKTLDEATRDGYVDNNIKVTLDSLFPTNSVMYINKQPYAIADVEWTKGDWKIEKKIHKIPELTNKNNNNNNNLVKNANIKRIISNYVTIDIDMDLQKGTTLSQKYLSNLKCRKTWNSVRKSYAKLRGVKYTNKPDYNKLATKSREAPETPETLETASPPPSIREADKSKTQKGGLGLVKNKFNKKYKNKTKRRKRHNNKRSRKYF